MDKIDKAEEHRLISKQLGWLSKHFWRLYVAEMEERGEEPKDFEDPNQLKLFTNENE